MLLLEILNPNHLKISLNINIKQDKKFYQLKDSYLYYKQIELIAGRLDVFAHIILVLVPKQVHEYKVQFDEVCKEVVQESVMKMLSFFLKINKFFKFRQEARRIYSRPLMYGFQG
jgi:hypothetical protein